MVFSVDNKTVTNEAQVTYVFRGHVCAFANVNKQKKDEPRALEGGKCFAQSIQINTHTVMRDMCESDWKQDPAMVGNM
jgi:hypothetical protein